MQTVKPKNANVDMSVAFLGDSLTQASDSVTRFEFDQTICGVTKATTWCGAGLDQGIAVAGANPALLPLAAEVRFTVIPTLSAPSDAPPANYPGRLYKNTAITYYPFLLLTL